MKTTSSAVSLCCGVAILLAAAVPLTAAAGRWSPVGPEGGGPQVIAAAPSSPERLYAVFSRVIYGVLETVVARSDDGGGSWQERNGGLQGERIIALAVDPQDADRAFAVAAVQGCFSDDPGGVYRTGDAGAHWQLVATEEQVGGLGCGASVLVLPDALLVGASGGVARSSDGGATWQAIPLTPSPDTVHTLLRDPFAEDVVYAIGWKARYKSSDSGLTWTLIHDPALPSGAWVTGAAVSPSDPETLYEYASGVLWRSRDGGATWSDRMPAPEAWDIYGTPLQVDPHDPDTLFLGSQDGIWVSRDGGATFDLLRQDLPTFDPVTDLALDTAGRILLATYKGLWSSADAGSHWTAAALHGIHANIISFLRFDPFNPQRLLFTSFDTLYETSDGGTTWAPLPLPQPGTLRALEFDPFRRGRLFALTVKTDGESPTTYQLFVSSDGGHHWGSPSSVPPGASALAVPAPDALLIAAGYRLYRRGGVSGTWRKVLEGRPTDEERGWFYFESIVRDPYRKDTLFAFGWDNFLHGGAKPVLYRSLDAGRTWGRWRSAWTSSLAFDPAQPESVYLEQSGVLFRHPIAGRGSQRIGRITAGDFVQALLVDRSDPETLFAATQSKGVLMSRDGGRHWSLLAPGLPLSGRAAVTNLVQDPLHPERLYSTPVTGGLWRVDLE